MIIQRIRTCKVIAMLAAMPWSPNAPLVITNLVPGRKYGEKQEKKQKP
jgi:hypothetical protein